MKEILSPLDEHNQKLQDHVHPSNWQNPVPKGRYNLVVIGAGTAGLVTAAGAAGLGAKVALIERSLMGGDCLNVGCVPSKAIITSGRVAAAVKSSSEFGVHGKIEKVDFEAVMERMRKLRSGISHHDSAKRFTELGIDVFLGQGTFLDDSTVQVGDQKLNFTKAVIATGARATPLPIPGLEDVGYLTNETIFSLTQQPKSLLILGGGPIGCEMAQTFARLGTKVTLIERAGHVLIREDEQAAKIVQDSLQRDGIEILTNHDVVEFRKSGNQKTTILKCNEGTKEVSSDEILVAIGRAPNIENLGLDNVGVKYSKTAVEVNDRLQTSNPKIYAAGDICSPFKFTHAADFMARIVIQNTLFWGRAKVSDLVIPWATYTSPELAHVGLTEAQAKQKNVDFDVYTQQLDGVDRAILESDDEGFVKVLTKKGSDQIIGATVVASNAGDMIGELTLAMKNKIGLKAIGSTIHPYPTQAEAIRKLGDQFNKTRLTPFIKGMFEKILRWKR